MKVQTDKIQESLKSLQSNNTSSTKDAEKLKKAKAVDGYQANNKQVSSAGKDVSTNISPKAVEFAKASEIARAAPDIREDRVADLKAQIQSGKYQVNADSIADKIFDEHLRTNGIGV